VNKKICLTNFEVPCACTHAGKTLQAWGVEPCHHSSRNTAISVTEKLWIVDSKFLPQMWSNVALNSQNGLVAMYTVTAIPLSAHTLATVSTSHGSTVRRSMRSHETLSCSWAILRAWRSTCIWAPYPNSVTSFPEMNYKCRKKMNPHSQACTENCEAAHNCDRIWEKGPYCAFFEF